MPIADPPTPGTGRPDESEAAAIFSANSAHGFLPALADGLIRYRWPLFVIGILLANLAIIPASRIDYDESIESFYSPDDPYLLDYLQSKEWFGGDEFVMVAYHDPDLLETEGLARVREFSEQLSAIPGVNAQSTQNLGDTLAPPDANLAVRIFLRFPSTHQTLLDFSRSILIGDDNETTSIVLRLLPESDSAVPRKETLAAIREMANPSDGLRRDREIAHRLAEIGAAVRQLRDDGAAQEDWDRLQAEVEPQRQEMIEYLDTSAAEEDETKQQLLQAARDLLPSIVGSSIEPSLEDEAFYEYVAEARSVLGPRAYVAGEPMQVNDMFVYVRQDGALLGWATSGMLILIILVLFRSLRWMVLPLLIVHSALLWTKAILVLSGTQLTMVSSILTSLITIIGIATVTHVTVRYRDLRQSLERRAAFRETVIDLAPAIFWTCSTTAIGFAALLSSGITPVRSFGTMVALGTMLILAGAFLLLPGGVLIGRFDADPRRAPAERGLLKALDKSIDWVQDFAWPLLLGFVALMTFAFFGLFRLTVETDFSKNFRENSPIVESIRFFEDRLGGVGTWEVNFTAPQESPEESPSASASTSEELTEEFVEQTRIASEKIAKIEMPDGTGPTKAMTLGDGTGFIPRIAGRTLDAKRQTLRILKPEFEKSLYNPEAGRMRIMMRALEQQPAETKLDLIDRVETVAQESFPDAKATGLYVLLAHLIQSLLADQLVSFAIATGGIAIMMTIAFRSLPIGLMSIIPNVFPILLVIGGMGWIGVPINIGTAMIASVSMGLTVDSSIHYLAGYRRAREAGLDHFAALRATHASVGRAVIFASAALVIGFTVLTLSNFIPLIYFGILVSLAMLGGLLGDLILLPLLLKWFRMPLRPAAVRDSALAIESAST